MTRTSENCTASVIVPCWNQLECTQTCVTALARHTRLRWELIAIDNGSTDGTGVYLRGLRDVAPFPVEVITNPENRGFPTACNQGMKSARGRYPVLLNNDTAVTDGWLDQLIALAECDKSIGLTGPMSNYASPPQLVRDVPYRDLEQMEQFARRFRDHYRGRWSHVEKLSGFCLLMKRRVLERLGGFDQQTYGLGLFDDDDLCLRARRAGFRLALAQDLFVHHAGSRTFIGANIDTEALLRENQKRFAAKWGASAINGQKRVALTPWAPAPAPPATLAGPPPRVALTMIVCNEEHNLPACLGSIDGLFSEKIIVDTGSMDRTVEIAQSFGARVFHQPWVRDFAAARNAALARATTDYIFWLDADDVIDPPEREKLEALLRDLRRGDDAAYVVRCACDPDGNGSGHTVVDHIRLFPHRENIRWTYRVHEQILPALRRGGVPVRWTDITIRHTGYTNPEIRRKKLDRDEAILREELAERPDDPFVHFNLGSIALERMDWKQALRHFWASRSGSAPTDSITLKLHALIARSHQMLGEPEMALAACRAGLEIESNDAELLFREAFVRRSMGDDAGAEGCWRRILNLSPPERFSSVDHGIYGHLTYRNLAVLAEERGDRSEAATLWREVLKERPEDTDAHNALGRLNGRHAANEVKKGDQTSHGESRQCDGVAGIDSTPQVCPDAKGRNE